MFPGCLYQQEWLPKFPDYDLLWDSDSVLGLEWARASALGSSCSRGEYEDDIVRQSNSAQVVEDMVEIIERHVEWREAEAKRLLANKHCGKSSSKPEDTQAIIERTRWQKGLEKIMYWGISYGTIPGQTFAAMHPDRVERLVIDGVLDPDDYYSGS